MSYQNQQNAWGSRTHRPRKRGWTKPGTHDAWEYNTIPWADREWMKSQQSDQDKAVLSRAITGGCEPPEED